MDTIIFGDSLAGNYGIAPKRSWSQILAVDATLNISQVIHKNGFTATDLLECLNREVLPFRPDRVILICGSNDALAMREASAILETVGVIAREVRNLDAELVWLLPPLMDASSACEAFGDPVAIFERANRTLKEVRLQIGRVDFPTIDLEELRLSFLKQEPSAFSDGLHFNPGFQLFLADSLREILFGS